MDFSVWQIVLVLVIALLVFGPRRLPELGSSLGQGMREFKDSITARHDNGQKARVQLPAREPRPQDGGGRQSG